MVLVALLMCSVCFAETLPLSWTNPGTKTDGTALTEAEKAVAVTAVEFKGPSDTVWTVADQVPFPGNTYTWTIPDTFVPGDEVSIRVRTIVGQLISEYSYRLVYTIPVVLPSPPAELRKVD